MRLRALALTTTLALTACGAPSSAKTSAAAPAGRAAAAPKALAFSAQLLDGSTFDGRALIGQPVALWFWAPW